MTAPVVHVNTQVGWRGGEQQTLHLASGLARTHPVVVVGRSGGDLLDRAQRAGLETRAMRTDRGLGAARCLRAILKELGPRVVHAHASKAHQVARIALWRMSAPLVVTRRVEFPLGRGPFRYWKYCRGVAAYGAISESVRSALVAGGVSCDRIQVIPSAADFDEISAVPSAEPSEVGLPHGARVVLHVGALNAQKNQDMLLRVWAQLQERYPDAHLLIAGTGSRLHELQAKAADLHLDRIHWLGFRTDVIAIMKCADVFLNTSRYEGLCSTLIQVRRCGVPVVATAVGGVPEIIDDEVNGLLVRLNDDQAMVEAAGRVLDERDMERIRRQVCADMDRFSVPHMTTAYAGLYDRVAPRQ